MLTPKLNAAIHAAPAGTSGLVCAPWTPGEVYGVAAKWAEASAPVYSYGDDTWQLTGRQVANYCHRPHEALTEQLAEALRASGDDPTEAIALADNSVEFPGVAMPRDSLRDPIAVESRHAASDRPDRHRRGRRPSES
jgi:hypothetical protein